MTIATTVTTVTYAGTGANTALATTFPFVAAADLIVTQRVIATGVETTLVEGTHYTVTGGGAGGVTGTVTPVNGATDFTSSVTWTISRSTSLTQSTDYVQNDNFPAESHEDALDKLTLIAQDAVRTGERALKVPLSDSTTISTVIPDSVSRASMYLGFNAAGVPVALAAPTGTSITTPFSLTLLDDNTDAEARTTLGSTTIGDALFIAASAAAARTTLMVDGNVQGKPPTVQVFTASGTYTKPAGLVAAIVEVVGGGGGCGGAAATAAGETAPVGGAGSGGYARKLIAAGSIGATETVTVGTGGAGGSAGNNDGSDGLASSFGAHATANPGTGSLGAAASNSANLMQQGSSGGTATGGDINIQGSSGGVSQGHNGLGHGGAGGHSVLSGTQGEKQPGATQTVGAVGLLYGGGASGACNTASQSAVAGSAGADGIVIVWEFY